LGWQVADLRPAIFSFFLALPGPFFKSVRYFCA
jgi:hypothetical protein